MFYFTLFHLLSPNFLHHLIAGLLKDESVSCDRRNNSHFFYVLLRFAHTVWLSNDDFSLAYFCFFLFLNFSSLASLASITLYSKCSQLISAISFDCRTTRIVIWRTIAPPAIPNRWWSQRQLSRRHQNHHRQEMLLRPIRSIVPLRLVSRPNHRQWRKHYIIACI